MHYQENYHYHGYASIFVWQKKNYTVHWEDLPMFNFLPLLQSMLLANLRLGEL